MPQRAHGESASARIGDSGDPGVIDFSSQSGLDGFASEELDHGGSSPPAVASSRWSSLDTTRAASVLPADRERVKPARLRTNMLSAASRAISQARGKMASISGHAAIATFVPRLVHKARLDRLVSPAAVVGQPEIDSASGSATLIRPRLKFDTRTAMLAVLAVVGFGQLWWVTGRLDPARSLAENASVTPAPPVVSESSEDVLSNDSKGADAVAMRVTFRTVTPAVAIADRETPSWVSVSAPVPVEIIERGQQIGTSWNGGMKLTPGTHDLRIVNRSMGLDLRKSVEIVSGGMASLSLHFPPGTLQISASPWATVDVDGVSIGKTPLDKIELSPGRHELVFTHPRFGQRKTNVTIKSGKLLRIGMDLRRRGR